MADDKGKGDPPKDSLTKSEGTIVKTPEQETEDLQKFLFYGDLSGLSKPAQNEYLFRLSKSMGLNPWMRPFDMILLNGKLTVYANKGCAQQLRNLYHVTLNKVYAGYLRLSPTKVDERIYEVEMEAVRPDPMSEGGFRRETETGAIPIHELQGEALSNAIMKCVTKAKRRATLSISEVALPDESEIESMQRYAPAVDAPQRVAPKPLPVGTGQAGPVYGATGDHVPGGQPAVVVVAGEIADTRTGEILEAVPVVAPKPNAAVVAPVQPKATVSRFPPAVPPVGVKPAK